MQHSFCAFSARNAFTFLVYVIYDIYNIEYCIACIYLTWIMYVPWNKDAWSSDSQQLNLKARIRFQTLAHALNLSYLKMFSNWRMYWSEMKQSQDHGTTVAVLFSDVLFPGLCNHRCKYVRISRGDFRGPMDESSNPHLTALHRRYFNCANDFQKRCFGIC